MLILLSTGKYILVEYSTNVSLGIKKIISDIKNCIDPAKTGIPIDAIAEIIICINFNLSNEEIEILRELIANTYIRLTIHTQDSLAIELNFNHRDLAHEFLGLALDTGQVVSIDRFVKEYDRAGHNIATPLNNVFLHREKEKNELIQCLNTVDFIILTGAPGIGKTKLALEGISFFLSQNHNFKAYCISYKNYELLTDLYQYLKPDEDFVLFVDDANRIDAFSQILGFYRAVRKGKLKIVMTVRDYAYHDLARMCLEFSPLTLNLEKFTDEQITDIIKEEPFEIKNRIYIDLILKIADGNPRLAIMAALLSKEHETPLILKDVSDLFDQYFRSFVKDTKELYVNNNIIALGLISFFYTLPYKEKAAMTSLLKNFRLEYHGFIEAIDQLEKLELVEIQYEHVKIAEQNLGIYFFYRTFIKEDLLPFDVLLVNYFVSHKARFRECVIAALNTFDDKLILSKIRPLLANYMSSNRSSHDKTIEFLEIFWYFLRTETLEYILHFTNTIDEPENPSYILAEEKNNDFGFGKDGILEILDDFFRTGYELKLAIELGLEYVRKNPTLYQQLIGSLKSQMEYSRHDPANGFFRQKIVFEFLIDRFNKDKTLYDIVFFHMAKIWLKFKYNKTEGGRNNAIVMYQYRVPLDEFLKSIRSEIWKTLNNSYLDFPTEVFDVLEDYSKRSPDVVKDVMEFDVPFVVDIIEQHLNPRNFSHCLYVHDQISWFKRHKLKNPRFELLLRQFTNKEYETFLKIDWDRFRDKEFFEFNDYKQYEKLKEREIRNSFILKSEKEVLEFYRSFVRLKSLSKNPWSYNNSLELVIDENFAKEPRIGLAILSTIIGNNNEIRYVPRRVFMSVLNRTENKLRIKEIIDNHDFQNKAEWLLSYFELMDEKLITEEDAREIIETVNNISTDLHLHLDRLAKYVSLKKDLFLDILRVIVEKNNQHGAKLVLWMDFFDENFEQVSGNIALVEKAYLQQLAFQDRHFDFDLKGLKKILKEDPTFIVEYLRQFMTVNGRSRDHRPMGFIWDIPNVPDNMEKLFDDYLEYSYDHLFGETSLNSFFSQLSESGMFVADDFLFDYIRKNAKNRKKVSLIVDIVLQSRKELLEKLLLAYVSQNQNPDDFGRIFWLGHGGLMSGDVNVGDKDAAGWRSILSMLDKSEMGIQLLPIRKWVSEMIEYSLRSADNERKRRFLERD